MIPPGTLPSSSTGPRISVAFIARTARMAVPRRAKSRHGGRRYNPRARRSIDIANRTTESEIANMTHAIAKDRSTATLNLEGESLEFRERDFFKDQILVHGQHLFSIEVNGNDDDGKQKRKPPGFPWLQQ